MSDKTNTGSKWAFDEMMMLYKLKTAGKPYSEIAPAMDDVFSYREYNANVCYKMGRI